LDKNESYQKPFEQELVLVEWLIKTGIEQNGPKMYFVFFFPSLLLSFSSLVLFVFLSYVVIWA
jgi:hypothetical protein